MQSNHILITNNKRITASPSAASHRRTAAAAQACAACKYQRRKCAADCILAPYFPHDRQRQFLNAHRLFGVSNIVKIVRRLDPPEKDAAMRTIVYQSEARAADPVGGCYRIIRDLEQQIDLATAELEIVLRQLALCRAAAGRQPAAGGDIAKWKENEDENEWGCMDGMDAYAHAESSSSFNLDHDHDHDLKIILENLSREDDEDDGFKFNCHENLQSNKNGILMEENATMKEGDGQILFIQDENELKNIATSFNLTNCEEIQKSGDKL